MEKMPANERNDETPVGGDDEVSRAKASSKNAPKKKRKSAVEDLKKNIEEQKQLAQDNYEKFLRAYAELENYKKRTEKDRADNLKYANEELLRDLLPFIDNLQRAVDHASFEKSRNPEALMEGVELTLRDLMRILEKHGLRPIESVGGQFDPNLHEAMMQVDSENHDPQTVVQEFQRGYVLKDRLLRPARVSVAMRPETQEKDETEQGESSSSDGNASD
jgi:molecular chaperone GrpE